MNSVAQLPLLTRMFALAVLIGSTQVVHGHGDMAPQPVDTTGLNDLGAEWQKSNPYRGSEVAIEIGSRAYNSNCARCHGLDVKSGGFAPDLRALDVSDYMDDWFINRVRKGAQVNGVVRMPPFEGLLSQEAMWAIRSYIDSRPDD